MRLTGEDKNSIREMMGCGQLDLALKELLKFRMDIYDKLKIRDKMFLNNNLSWVYRKKEGCKEFAKFYTAETLALFTTDKVKRDYAWEYYNCIWINAELNKGNISETEYNRIFLDIYKYHKKMNNKRYYLGAIQNIVFNTKNDDKIIKFMKTLIDKYGNDDVVSDMVVECELQSNYVYINVKAYYDSKKLKTVSNC